MTSLIAKFLRLIRISEGKRTLPAYRLLILIKICDYVIIPASTKMSAPVASPHLTNNLAAGVTAQKNKIDRIRQMMSA